MSLWPPTMMWLLMHHMMISAWTMKPSSSVYTWADMQAVQVGLNKSSNTLRQMWSHCVSCVSSMPPTCISVSVFVQAMRFVAMTRSRTRTRLRSAPRTWTTTAATLSALSTTARWRAAALSTTRQDGGSTSADWQTSTAPLRMRSRAKGRGQTFCGTPGDRTGSLTPSNLSR